MDTTPAPRRKPKRNLTALIAGAVFIAIAVPAAVLAVRSVSFKEGEAPPPVEPEPGQESVAIADASPTNPKAWARLCAYSAKQFWRDQSLADCDKAVALNPGVTKTQMDRAFLNMKVGKYDQSMADFEAVLKREPQNARAMFARGLILTPTEPAASIRDRRAAIAISPSVVVDMEQAYGFKVPWEARRP